jgi:hypothetical protein
MRASENADAIHAGSRSYPLSGYARRALTRTEVVATTTVLESVCDIVGEHGTLYSWARHQTQPRALAGRAPVYVATLSDADQSCVVVRHSWHGGLLSPITGDRFMRPTRAPLELLRSFMLRECGIATPEVLGFALYDAGPMLARVDVLTRYVDNAYDFAAVLSDFGGDISRAAAYSAIQTLLVKLASYGFTHPDLNIKNILLHTVNREIVATVLDVDVVKWDASLKPAQVMLANISRLARSMKKSRLKFGVTLPDTELNDFVARVLQASPATSMVREKSSDVFSGVERL